MNKYDVVKPVEKPEEIKYSILQNPNQPKKYDVQGIDDAHVWTVGIVDYGHFAKSQEASQ